MLSTLPPATVAGQIDISGSGGNESSPSISIDKANPQKMVAVWTRYDPGNLGGPSQRLTQSIVQGAYSINGGQSWTSFAAMGTLMSDWDTSNPVLPYDFATDASVGFDRNNNVYVLYAEHNDANTSGALIVRRFDFSGNAPALDTTLPNSGNQVITRWDGVTDPAFSPMLAVDDNLSSFTDPSKPSYVQTDLNAGNVYVAWSQRDIISTNPALTKSDIKVIGSSDGGHTFTTESYVNDDVHGGVRDPAPNILDNYTPRLVVSQGRPANPTVYGPGDQGVTGGQVSIIWDANVHLPVTTPPPNDQIKSDAFSNGATGVLATGTTGAITDAAAGTPDNVPATTPFTADVSIGNPNLLISDLDVTVAIVHPAMAELKLVLMPPVGSGLSPITLLNNGVDASNTATGSGLTGADLGGPTTSGARPGTIFDEQAARSITAAGSGAASVGHYRPQSGQATLSEVNGLMASQINGTWTLQVTDFRNNNVGTVQSWSLRFTSGLGLGQDRTVASTTVKGIAPGLAAAFPTAAAVDPAGIGPAPVITSDNTLGAFSPYEGRLYVAYVNRYVDPQQQNQPDNTDIFLAKSDDGGLSWQSLGPLNDDNSLIDGFSESSGANTNAGRPQFQPSLAVDPATGTLVASYYDARYDASRARVTMMVTASIDGGQSFNSSVFANTPKTAYDAATGKTVVLEPIPDNQSPGNGSRETNFGFGTRQGLDVNNGHVVPVWSSNLNGGASPSNLNNPLLLDIRTAQATIAAGPRVVSNTMGPVGQPGDGINNSRDTDGTPKAGSILVVFDRPIPSTSTPGDPNVFDPSDVKVFFHGTDPNAASMAVPVTSITPVGDPNNTFFNGYYGYTHFVVNFVPQSAVGTYSYEIGPNLRDRIRSVVSSQTAAAPINASSADVPLTVPAAGTGGSGTSSDVTTSTLALSGHPNQTITGVALHLTNLAHTRDGDLTIVLVAPDGRQVTLYSNTGDNGANFLNTTFTDSGQPLAFGVAPYGGSFRPSSPLSALNGGPVDGTWKLVITDNTAGNVGQLNAWSLTVNSVVLATDLQPGALMDQNANAQPGQDPAVTGFGVGDVFAAPTPLVDTTYDPNHFFKGPYDPTTLPLIVPGPHVIDTYVPGSPDSGDNLVLNNTVSEIDVVFDRDMNPATFTAAQILRVIGPAGPISGPFTVQPGSDARTFRIGLPTQQISGTYRVILGSGIQDARGQAVDTNLNAGVDALRGTAVNVPTITTSFPATIPTGGSTIPDASLSSPGVLVSTISVPDDFVIQGVTASGRSGLTLTLNINDLNVPDLEATLIGPDGTSVKLFTNVGNVGNRKNFQNTVLDDQATTPIQFGGPPFFGTFNPQQSLLAAFGDGLHRSGGTWQLVLQDDNANGITGTLTSWSLTFEKPVPTSGLGEPVADQSTSTFRIFTMDPTNPLSSSTWTAVGPASIGGGSSSNAGGDGGTGGGTGSGGTGGTGSAGGSFADDPDAPVGGRSGRVTGLAFDPSDPSFNTAYVGGASGGIWKTTDFLRPGGPTYTPLTDFGPTQAINIGGIAVFGRNGDTNQSIIFAATGEGDTASPGVGFLRSMDGGATWQVLDSTNNFDASGNLLPIDSPQRDHKFVGSYSFKIVVDPKPTPDGNVIVYAALSGPNGGLWRSLDTGKTWQLMRAGQATDIALDPNSGTGAPGGNLQNLWVGFRGEGVYFSNNRGQSLTQVLGGVGDPLIQDSQTDTPIPVGTPSDTPNGNKGRIVLAKPDLTGLPSQDLIYQGWLYALVVGTDGHVNGLYLTKDFGQNWTKLDLPYITRTFGKLTLSIPSNDSTLPNSYDVGGSGNFTQGNYDISIGIDPTNPNIVYLGGTADGQSTGFIRVDATKVADPHALVPFKNSNNDGGLLEINTTGPATVADLTRSASPSFLNLIRDPQRPFVANATLKVSNTGRFINDGSGVTWIPFDIAGTDQHRIVTFRDPQTGLPRLVIGDDQGVFTAIDDNGTLDDGAIGNAPGVDISRNGNLQITQMYYGAAQPSNLAAQIAGALFYGSTQDNGGPASDLNVLDNGNIIWNGPGGDATGVATDQQGNGTLYQYWWPCCGGNGTDFFQVNGTGRTFGLLQQSGGGLSPDPQWPYLGGSNFAVNPLSGQQVIMSSQAGRIFRTENQGLLWLPIAEPGDLDGTYAPALAYGAPDPNGPGGIGNFDNFLYVGTSGGHVYVSQTGGGSWTDISAGLGGSGGVQAIIPNPTRGSHEAYAVTSGGVFHITDSTASGATWTRITGNLFQVLNNVFPNTNNTPSQGSATEAKYLTSLAVDWRYVIPNDFSQPGTDPSATHPILYVGSEGGVYRSIDDGTTWSLFPDSATGLDGVTPATASLNSSPRGAGGGLPNAHVTDLDMVLGNINPTTGRPDVSTGPNVLMASTYGRGAFAIRLAPIVFPNQSGQHILGLDPASDSGLSNSDGITNNRQPFIIGYSEQTAFGNDVTINLLDQTPGSPTFGQVIGTGKTDSFGHFRVQVATAGGGVVPLFQTDGPKVIGVQATNASGTKGNIAIVGDALSPLVLDTTPPDPAQLPDLQNGSDTGPNNADEITNPNIVAAPNTGALLFNVAFAATEVNTQVTLYRDNVVVGQPVLGTGTAVVNDPGTISPDGEYAYKVRLTDQAGNVSADSPLLNVRVDTKAPAQPSQPKLDPINPTGGSDSGNPTDNITNVRQPFFIGSAEANTLPNPNDPSTTQRNVVTLQDQTNYVFGTGFVKSDGTYSVQPTAPLGDGTYTFHVSVTDLAGNVSLSSNPITVTIQSATPPTPTLQMVLTDDSGVPGDNITNVKQPRFQGTGKSGLTVQIVDVNGLITGTAGGLVPFNPGDPPVIVANDNSFSFKFPTPLPDTTPGQSYKIAARTIDIAGNYADSAPVSFQILTTGPTDSTVIGLLAADDTGTKGDNVTSLRQIRINGTGATPGATVVLLPPGVTPSPDMVLGQTTADASGRFILQPSTQLQNGILTVVAREVDAAGNYGPPSRALINGQVTDSSLSIHLVTTTGDYTADGRADLASLNRNTGAISFGITGGGNLTGTVGVAGPDTVPIQGDFDGDGKTDYGVVDFRTDTWTIQRSQLGKLVKQFGWGGVDLPITGDFDGDGKTDIGVFRPFNSTWYVVLSGGGVMIQQFGEPNRDRPLPGDYDGDGKTDLMIYRPDTSEFIGRLSGGSVINQQFGWAGVDVPVTADFNGDGKTDLAVYRPLNATFYALYSGSGGGALIQAVGSTGAVPVPQDYDGDGKADPTVFNPSTRQWIIRQSSNNTTITRTLGSTGDVPLGAPLEPYRMPAGTSSIAAASLSLLAKGSIAAASSASPSVASVNAAAMSVSVIAPAVGTQTLTTNALSTPSRLGQGRNTASQDALLGLTLLGPTRQTTLPAQATPSAWLALGFGRRFRG